MVRMAGCGCTDADLVRIPRLWWMRLLFPWRRAYRCTRCDADQLLERGDVVAMRNRRSQGFAPDTRID